MMDSQDPNGISEKWIGLMKERAQEIVVDELYWDEPCVVGFCQMIQDIVFPVRMPVSAKDAYLSVIDEMTSKIIYYSVTNPEEVVAQVQLLGSGVFFWLHYRSLFFFGQIVNAEEGEVVYDADMIVARGGMVLGSNGVLEQKDGLPPW